MGQEERNCFVCDVCFRTEPQDYLKGNWFWVSINYVNSSGAGPLGDVLVCGEVCLRKAVKGVLPNRYFNGDDERYSDV